MGETMSDWIISMKARGLQDLANGFHSEKVEDLKRLEESGLPVFSGLSVAYFNFKRENAELMIFLKSCVEGIVIRALPNTPQHPRRYKIGVKGFEECEKFLRENVVSGAEYNVYMSEWEPQDRSAIIISSPEKVLLEVGSCGLDELSHGGDTTLSFKIDLTKIGHLENKATWTKQGDSRDREVAKQALKEITLNPDSFNPLYLRGYFEIVATTRGKVKFVDYKINQLYLK